MFSLARRIGAWHAMRRGNVWTADYPSTSHDYRQNREVSYVKNKQNNNLAKYFGYYYKTIFKSINDKNLNTLILWSLNLFACEWIYVLKINYFRSLSGRHYCARDPLKLSVFMLTILVYIPGFNCHFFSSVFYSCLILRNAISVIFVIQKTFLISLWRQKVFSFFSFSSCTSRYHTSWRYLIFWRTVYVILFDHNGQIEKLN